MEANVCKILRASNNRLFSGEFSGTFIAGLGCALQ
jgi:hypothetical protein